MPRPALFRADFSDGLGEAIGRVLRAIVDGLAAFIAALWHTVGRFLRGLAHGLGVNDSFFSLALVAVGLLLLWGAVRAAARRSFAGAFVLVVLGVTVLSWLMS